jgi:hypothetical protein
MVWSEPTPWARAGGKGEGRKGYLRGRKVADPDEYKLGCLVGDHVRVHVLWDAVNNSDFDVHEDHATLSALLHAVPAPSAYAMRRQMARPRTMARPRGTR